MLRLKDLTLVESRGALSRIPAGKMLINTINAHSYNTAQNDALFAEALRNGDYLIPDGASIVMACRWLKAKSQPKERIAGWDLFVHEMNKVNEELLLQLLMSQHSSSAFPTVAERCFFNSSFCCLHSSFTLFIS